MFGFAFSAFAETVVDVSGQVRSRGEASRTSFDDNSSHVQTFKYLRTRLNIKAIVDKNATAFIQFQDSRILGESGQSSGLKSTANVDLHQAFLKYNLWTKEKWSVGVLGGRFEFNWGNQRLLGAVGWSNIGRSWEGGMAWYDAQKFNVTFASLKKREDNSTGYNSDFDVYAVTAKLKNSNLNFLTLFEVDADTIGLSSNVKMLNRATLAAYYKKKLEQIDMEFNLAFQGGTQAVLPEDFNPLTDIITNEQDISAVMFAGELGYSFKGEKNGRVALAIDYASGDDGTDTTKFKTFNNLYWTGHKFNGYMDYFLKGGPNGLVDIALRGKFDFTQGWTFLADLHLFSSAENYALSLYDNTPTKDIGSELDLAVKTSRVKGVALKLGGSFFTPKDDFAAYKQQNDAGFDINTFKNKSSFWGYFQAIVNF